MQCPSLMSSKNSLNRLEDLCDLSSLENKSNLKMSDLSKRNKFPQLTNLLVRMFPYYSDIRQCKVTPENPLERLFYEPLFIKSGVDLYMILFVLELCIFFAFIMFYSSLTGKAGSLQKYLAKNRFTGEMVVVIMIIILIILFNRICYSKKFSVLDHSLSHPDQSISEESFNVNNIYKSTSMDQQNESSTQPREISNQH